MLAHLHVKNLALIEEIEVEFLTMDELKQLIRENKIVQSMHVTCILYALERLNELKY